MPYGGETCVVAMDVVSPINYQHHQVRTRKTVSSWHHCSKSTAIYHKQITGNVPMGKTGRRRRESCLHHPGLNM